MLCVCLCLFVAMWSGLERERTLRSPQGAVDIRTVGLICGAGRVYHRERERERESCVGGMMRGRATRGCIRGSGLALM